MSVLPKALDELITELGSLPGVGPRTAERYAYFLLKNQKSYSSNLIQKITNLHTGVAYCPVTFALIDSSQQVSPLYSDPGRDKQTVAVVSDVFDLVALEKTGQFKGTYHVLKGLISPLEGVGPEDLTINQLVKRVTSDKVKELILAINSSIEGETTALYIQKKLSGNKVKITRLARGLPMGLELEYADQVTLGRALEGRQKLNL